MIQTSFGANLVRAEPSAFGVARAFSLFDYDKLFTLLVFQIFLHMFKAAFFFFLGCYYLEEKPSQSLLTYRENKTSRKNSRKSINTFS